jgi:GT2 family glycosyltransferase
LIKSVTALIDTYNHDAFLARAIESVLSQDTGGAQLDVVVVDDGSTDCTADVVEQFGKGIRYLRKENGGQATAFNQALPMAKGDIVALLDGDDFWLPGKLRRVMEAFESDASIGLVGHGIDILNRDGATDRLFTSQAITVSLSTHESAQAFVTLKPLLGTSRMTVRQSVLERVLPVPEELTLEADEWIFTIAAAVAPIRVLDASLTCYRMHSGNLYEMPDWNPEGAARKANVLFALANRLPDRLMRLGVSEEVIDTVVRPLSEEGERLLAGAAGISRASAARLELRRAHGRPQGLRARAFRFGAAALALLIGPRRYHQLRRWYASRGLNRVRHLVIGPTESPTGLLQKVRLLPAPADNT